MGRRRRSGRISINIVFCCKIVGLLAFTNKIFSENFIGYFEIRLTFDKILPKKLFIPDFFPYVASMTRTKGSANLLFT